MGFTLAEKGGDSTRWSPLTDDLSDPANFDLCSAADPDLCTNSPEGLLSGLFDAQHINQDAQSAADPTPPSDGELAHLVYTVAALLVVTLLWWAIAALVSRAARRVRRLRGSASQDRWGYRLQAPAAWSGLGSTSKVKASRYHMRPRPQPTISHAFQFTLCPSLPRVEDCKL